VVRSIVIPVEGFLTYGNGCPDCRVVLVIDRSRCQVFVDVVHGRDDRRDAGCAAA